MRNIWSQCQQMRDQQKMLSCCDIPISSCKLCHLDEKGFGFLKALNIENFKYSFSRLDKFKKRLRIRHKAIYGESASVDELIIENSLSSILEVVHKFGPQDIFKADATGLFFKMLINKILSSTSVNSGMKQAKNRVTILFGSNMEGNEELKPLMIILFDIFYKISCLALFFES